MQKYYFSVRRLTGEFYAHVYPFDTKFFRKVHHNGALLFSGVHSHLMLLQHVLIHLPKAKKPIYVLSDVPKYWQEDDGAMCSDESYRWKWTSAQNSRFSLRDIGSILVRGQVVDYWKLCLWFHCKQDLQSRL